MSSNKEIKTENLLTNGLTDEEICRFLNITVEEYDSLYMDSDQSLEYLY
ncbi:hypothetical protein [Ornithinibacillus scapharcae]|nr:hypothetical protein [Ornithinibacillus scapharcae]